MEKVDSRNDITRETYIDCKIDSGKKLLDSVKKQDKHQITTATLPKKAEIKECNENDKATDRMLLNNGIVKGLDATIVFSCTVCKRIMPSLHDTLSHIKGKSHTNGRKRQTKNLIENSVTNDRNLLTKSTEKEKYLIVGNISEDKNNNARDKKKTVAKDCSYRCELCVAQIDINCVSDHISTVTHKFKITSKSIKDDTILYKCLCCKSIIPGTTLFVNHLRLETHLNKLTSALRGTKTRGGTRRARNKNFELCNVLIFKAGNEDACFEEKCLIFFDASLVDLSNSVKNNIQYRCSFCSAKLNNDHNLIEHCKASTHMKFLTQLSLGTPHSSDSGVASDTMSIVDRFNKISISDAKSCVVKTVDTDLDIPKDVQREIKHCLGESPFLVSPSERARPKKPPLRECLNKVYDKRYLEMEEVMYTLSKKKLDAVKSNVGLLIPQGNTKLYCMVCNTTVSRNLYLLYEHICIASHRANVKEAKEADKKLFEQYMRRVSEDSVKCYPCGVSLRNNPLTIDSHVNTQTHKNKYKKFYKVIDSKYNCVLREINRLWYSIQRYSCAVCKTGYAYKLEFIEHIIKTHSPIPKDHVFDFCIPCATLWLGQINCYTQHCSDIMHKYLLESKDFMVEDLPGCIKELLTQVDETADILIQQTQVLSNDNIQEEVIRSLENSIKPYLPSVKAFLFGSRVTGLGFSNSDIDIYLDCGDTSYKNETERSKICFTHITQALQKRKEEWEVKAILRETRTPIIKLIYKRTGVHCDITVTSGLAVANSKLIRSFNDAYPPGRKMILFIKKWFSLFNLPGRHGFTNYSLVWFVIFYLQGKSYLPSVATLIKERNDSRVVCGWETGVAQPKRNDKPERPISELLLDFFKFYANYDYQHYVICPLLGYSLTKKAFVESNALPKEMKRYTEHLSRFDKPEYFRIDSSLCVQDPFDLSHNLTKAVTSISLKCFKQYCQDSAAILLSTMQ